MRGFHAAARPIALALAILLPVTIARPTTAIADDYKVGTLKIEHPWSRATAKGFKVAGGFMKITNTGSEADRLIGGSFALAQRLEVHEMSMTGGVMKMQELKDGLEIKPGQTVELKPGGYHVMFMEMAAPMDEGIKQKGTLIFQKAGTIEIEYAVHPRGTSGVDGHQPKAGSSSGHDHGGHGSPKQPKEQ